MDRPVDPAAATQGRVRRVYDYVNVRLHDVASDDNNA